MNFGCAGCCDHQLCRKEQTNTELLEKILVDNFGSSGSFINKAISLESERLF